jgi:hypothetical protein
VTRGFMGPLGGFWPKPGRSAVSGGNRVRVPAGRVITNKQTIKKSYLCLGTDYTYQLVNLVNDSKRSEVSPKVGVFLV